MKGSISISDADMAMVDELCPFSSEEEKCEFMGALLRSSIEILHKKLKAEVDKAEDEFINGTGTGGKPKGFLKPQRGSR